MLRDAVLDLENRVRDIQQRNRRVEADKAWETSWTRRAVIAALIYVFSAVFLILFQESDKFLLACVPVGGFFLSTVSLRLARPVWEKYFYKVGEPSSCQRVKTVFPEPRLTPQEILSIKATAENVFGKGTVARLFGSRTNPSARGGDIDLLIEVDNPAKTDFEHEARFRSGLEKLIGERKIDVQLHSAGQEMTPMKTIALSSSIVL